MKQNNHILLIILMIIFYFITGCSSAQHTHDYIDGVCSCGKIDVFNHEHAYNIKKVEATCINREYTKYKCVFCDYEYKEFTAQSEKLKHNLINDVCEYCNSTRDSNGILYRFDDLSKEYCVVGVDNPIGEVEILSKYNDFAVTSISDYAFYHCEGIKNIIIPNSVVSIGYGAFCDCKDLINITIPNSITKIEPGTFLFCINLKEIIIPESVTSIGESAFFMCFRLTSITIPEGVTSIGEAAFYNCTSLTNINVSDDNSNYKSIDGNLYSKDGTQLIRYAIGKQDKEFTIPSNVTSIEFFAFEGCTSLTSIEIPSSVTSIEKYAFYNCTSLTSIEIPSSVTSIGEGAFEGCTSLTSIEIPSSVTSIGKGAFFRCSSLSIYCEVSSQPSGWNQNWNISNCKVYWNC